VLFPPFLRPTRDLVLLTPCPNKFFRIEAGGFILYVFTTRTPPGWIAVALSEAGVKALVLPQNSCDAALNKLAVKLRVQTPSLLPALVDAKDVAQPLADDIERYFQGERVSFSTMIDWSGYTPFQLRILLVVKAIQYGEIRSYKQVALEAGLPKAVRTVGGVMRSNRTPLLIPCHRVISSDGSLGGFSEGLEMKKYLLNLEKAPGF